MSCFYRINLCINGSCSLHANFWLKLEALRISFDATFWSKVFCCTENYNSECWKRECNEWTNGKKTPFPGTPDNQDVIYKGWRQNDHKRLALYTKEFQVGELKKNLLEGFNNFRKHVRVKRMMYATFERDKLDPNCMLLQVGFAMAYSSECQNEYQPCL